MIQQPLRFLAVGVSNTVVGLASIYVAVSYFGMSDVSGNAFGYSIGFIWSFFLNRAWTFRSSVRLWSSLPLYLAVCITAYACNLVTLISTKPLFPPASFVPQICALVTYSLVAYMGSKWVAFRTPR